MQQFRYERGQILPLVALLVTVLVGATGFAVDVGYHQYQQRIQQTATDAAALAGAQEAFAGDYAAAVKQSATANGYTDNTTGTCPTSASVGTVCVQVNSPPQAPDAYAGNSRAVEVKITTDQPTFFEKVFHIATVRITTKAVGVLKPQNRAGCVYVLSGQANFNAGQSGGTLNAPDCAFLLNGNTNFNNAVVTAGSIDCAATCSNGTFMSASPVTTAPASDPCTGLSYCAYLASHPPTTCNNSYTAPTNAVVTVNPGCYSSLDLHKASSVTFNCGMYVITGALNASSTASTPITINQSSCGSGGVTFYIKGSGSVAIKNANMNLAAPTLGDYSQYATGEQNTLFYQDPADTNTAVLQAASCATCAANLSGMLYFPTAPLNYNSGISTNSGNALIVSGTLNYNGSNTTIFNPPASGAFITSAAVLGE
jgi:Flp pilus assembly protein TadG